MILLAAFLKSRGEKRKVFRNRINERSGNMSCKSLQMLCMGLILVITSCTDKSFDAREYGNDIEYLKNGTIKVPIDIDNEDRYTVIPNANTEPLIKIEGNLTDVERFNGQLVFTDAMNNNLLITDEKFDSVQSIGRRGRGPYEYLKPDEIIGTKTRLYVHDNLNMRFHILDTAYQELKTVSISYLARKSSAAGTTDLLLIPDTGDEQYVYAVYKDRLPLQRGRGFMQRIVPLGQQPMTMNSTKISYSKAGNLYSAYVGLPYIFSFTNDLDLRWVLELSGESMERFFNEPSKHMGASQRNSKMVRILFNSIAVNDTDTYLYISIRGVLYGIDLREKEIIGSWFLNVNDWGFSADRIRIHDPYLYVYDQNIERMGRVLIKEDGKLNHSFELLN